MPHCVVTRSPMLAQHANSLRAVCTRIASTACVMTQAPFSQVSFKRKLEKIGLQRAYPPDPLSASKSEITPSEFLTFCVQNT